MMHQLWEALRQTTVLESSDMSFLQHQDPLKHAQSLLRKRKARQLHQDPLQFALISEVALVLLVVATEQSHLEPEK